MVVSEKIVFLSISILLIAIVVSTLLYVPLAMIGWEMIPALVLTIFGSWLVILAGFRASTSQKGEHRAFNTFTWGLWLIALGGAWYLYPFNPIYSLAAILLALAVLGIAAAVRAK
jgi:hypothetical protein